MKNFLTKIWICFVCAIVVLIALILGPTLVLLKHIVLSLATLFYWIDATVSAVKFRTYMICMGILFKCKKKLGAMNE